MESVLEMDTAALAAAEDVFEDLWVLGRILQPWAPPREFKVMTSSKVVSLVQGNEFDDWEVVAAPHGADPEEADSMLEHAWGGMLSGGEASFLAYLGVVIPGVVIYER